MKLFFKLYFFIFILFTFFSISIIYLPTTSNAGCTDTDDCNNKGCDADSHCRTSTGCCIPDDPPPPGGGCTGPASCASSECCVAGSCEPKTGSSCGGGGSLSCPSGTQPNPISPFPGCTSSGNCCCALPQNCPLNMACGTTTTVPDGQCGLRTCTGAPCPTTPPTGCSSNPSSCGVGRCCNSNVCGNCPATPPPTTPPATRQYYNVVVYNDPTNTCDRELAGYAPIYDRRGNIIGYDTSKPWYRDLNSRIGWPTTDPVWNTNVMAGGYQIPLLINGGYRRILNNSQNLITVTLSQIPEGYKCSDGPGCQAYNYGGGYYSAGNTCPTNTNVASDTLDGTPGVAVYYITNQGVPPPPPPVLSGWWQVKDGEATTNGNLTSKLPAGSLFNIVGLGGFHGLPVFGGSLNTGSGTVSTLLWNANTQGSYTRVFDYSYFENLIPDDVVLNDVSTLATGTGATTYSDGYQWYRVNGNYTINSDVNFGTRKVILFVKSGNLTINGKVNLDDNQGFFGTFVNGSISINPALTNTAPNPAIEGIFLSDNTFTTGAGNSLLHLRGSVVSLGNITLGRNLSNNATNAELFEFAPDLISLFPEKLRFKRTKWTEVAP